MRYLVVFYFCLLLLGVTSTHGAKSLQSDEVAKAILAVQLVIDGIYHGGDFASEEVVAEADLPTKVDLLSEKIIRRDTHVDCSYLHIIACGATCMAQGRGRGFCDNGKCACK